MIKPTLVIAALLGATAGYAQAGQPGADWMPMDQVVRKLGEAGYGEIRSLKADDGRWEGKAVKDGRPVAVAIDPRSGGISELAKAEKDAWNDAREGEDD